jgi:hypothetical protein
MGVKIFKKLQVLTLIERAREDFKKELEKIITPEIIKTIEGGSSPIKAQKQAKYSDNYIDQIEGRAKFFKGKNGGVYRVTPKMLTGEQTSLRISKSGKVKQGKTKKATFEKFEKGLGVGKKKSPVNLKLTGELHNSIDTIRTNNGVEVYFKDKKAEWHNKGVPERNLPARRLLPTEKGEEFNYNIWKRIREAIMRALKNHL